MLAEYKFYILVVLWGPALYAFIYYSYLYEKGKSDIKSLMDLYSEKFGNLVIWVFSMSVLMTSIEELALKNIPVVKDFSEWTHFFISLAILLGILFSIKRYIKIELRNNLEKTK